MSEERPILYSFRRCPYAMRARMAILVSDRQVELREVVLRDKPAHMLEISPKGEVPVLLLGNGTVVDESLDVMSWALEQSDPNGWLGQSSNDLSEMQDLIGRCDGDFKHHLDRYKYASRYEGAEAEEHREAAEVFLQELEERLAANSFLFGPEPLLADYAIMPFIRQFANTDRGWFDASPYINLQAWLEGLLASDTFLQVMPKYAQWHAGDEVTLFPA